MNSSQLLPRAGYRFAASGLIARITAAAVTCITFLLCATPAVVGADRFWILNTGGAFGSSASWSTTSGGAGGATPPGAADVAIFSPSPNPVVLNPVVFSVDVTNNGLAVNNATVTFDLGGKTYTLTNATNAVIGAAANQTGRLTLRNGVLDSDSDSDVISLGAASLSTGFLTVSTGGRIGNGINDPSIFIGQLGSGTFAVEKNTLSEVGFINLGQAVGATGTLTVNGNNAIVEASKSMTIGFGGTGTVNVQNGGKLGTDSYVRIGNLLGSAGTTTVSGLGSRWTQGSLLTVGDEGTGSMTIENAAEVTTAGEVWIGNTATGAGSTVVTGADSQWSMSSNMRIGRSGLGTFVVSSGGLADTAGTTTVAEEVGGQGYIAVAGAGARWNSANIVLGTAGAGNLSITSAGIVDTTGSVSLASAATGSAIAKLSGAGSAWNVSGNLNVAAAGTANFTVESDAILTVDGALTVANPTGSPVGELNLNGGTISAGSFTRAAGAAFNWTNGTLVVKGGAFSNAGENLVINGETLDDVPALRLSSGAQSSIASVPNLTIGSSRKGAAIVSGGSNFLLTSASIGSLDGGTGSLVVEGAGSSFATTGDLNVGGTTAATGGLGSITLGSGGTIAAGGALRLWSGASVTMSGGTLSFNNLVTNGGKLTFNSGTVKSLSTFNASSAALDAIVGSTRVLGFGRKIDSMNNIFNLQSDLNVTGGAVAGSVLSVSSGVVARFEAAGTGTFSGGVVNPAGARIYVTEATLSAGSTFANSGEVRLAGEAATINGASFANSGLVLGHGRINAPITNNSAGQVRVGDGERLEILGASGTNVNNGLIDVNGGTVEFGRVVTNSSSNPSSGLIAARDATLRFEAGLSNSGALTFSSGVSDVFGNVTNVNNLSTPGRIVVTGGAQANFLDDVVNNGSIQVSGAGSLQSTAVFLGSLSGNGVNGGGHVFIEGDARPGFSPGTMSFGGDLSLGPLSTLNIELAGTNPGTQYDRVVVADSASISGDLDVTLLGDYQPVIGTTFQILSAAGGLSGTFNFESLPELAGGASWSVGYGSEAVTLEVGGVLGDFNHDGRVDAADYTVWRDQLGSNALASDASGNGSVDQADYNIWKANFGQVVGAGAALQPSTTAAVPEPNSFVFAALLGGCLSLVSRRRS